MLLITEVVEDAKFELLEENGKKNLYITGPFLVSEQVNKNRRMYREDIMDKAAGRYIAEKVDTGQGWGELGHPAGPGINLPLVSHRIVSLTKRGNIYEGRAIITSTTNGDCARGLIESGGTLGVSSRGMGTLQERNGTMYVQDDYHIATAADIVADPSAPGAFVQGIMEGVEWFMNPSGGWSAVELVENTKKEMTKLTRAALNEKKLELFETFLNSLNSQYHK